MRTFQAKAGEVDRRWFIVDAAAEPLGRTASKVAMVLMGKNKPQYTPHVDVGDFVVVINAAKTKLTGNKLEDKLYHHHTGWIGGLVSLPAKLMLEDKPTEVVRLAVKGMLPKTKLGRAMLRKLKIHAGELPAHGYVAQQAMPLDDASKKNG